ncbi:Regulator of telomere elongation helicase 1 -like protein [Babesia sp. Xinjiang]|uniref:Regulator of telomere elongation helicase 1 -like protein n=1 Tax=Babesia sp. Xinjiang TaxID=462227 RepID=UPI000A219C80|nr:Regulator of telomere elongation helicase 1 -like protein [Babesia sp. Xinjiang]ORM39969.1 Regulator of telomere elongation helicase 1 -like protein [Babesia sp. Xinjiang]
MATAAECIQIIDGIEVRFPYEPYQSQKVYMETVIKAVKNGKNALLESPTGTGKTLSLICSTLACIWHTRFKDGSIFKPQETVPTSLDGILSTISELRNSSNPSSKGGKGKGPQRMNIIYASRTHSQLKQVIKEAKKTSYSHEFAAKGLTTVVLGSRDQLCIHPGRRNATGEALNTFCRKMVQTKGCIYYNGMKKGQAGQKIQFYEFMDIEDLVLLGKSRRCCPFYASRDAHEIADVTLLPYNYLLSPMSRDALEIRLKNSVLIIDEAHNVESLAEGAAAFTVRQVDVARYLMALRRFVEAHKKVSESQQLGVLKDEVSIDFSSLAKCAVMFKNLDKFLTNIPIGSYTSVNERTEMFAVESWQVTTISREHAVFRGRDILDLLMRNIGLHALRELNVDEVIKHCIDILSANVDDVAYAYQQCYESAKILQEDVQALNSMLLFLHHIFSKELLECPEYFHVFVTHDQKFSDQRQQGVVSSGTSDPPATGGGWKSKVAFKDISTSTSEPVAGSGPLPKVMVFECLQATPSFLRLKNEGVRSIILTSGTLSPLRDLERSIGGNKLSFEYKLSNEHIISTSNVFPRVITGGEKDAHILSSDYKTRSTPAYIKALGEALLVFSRCVPAGILVFFGSYPVMEDTITAWKRAGIYAQIEREKALFVESRSASHVYGADSHDRYGGLSGSDATQAQLKEYNTLVAKGRGCMFIGVCRGKIAEGIDFSDDACRGVFVCGVPYPNPYDESIALKMDYLRKQGGSGRKDEAVTQWYTSQAIRAVNQAIGRVIRHINDYGAIVLADRRFASPNLLKGVSSWVTRNMETKDSMMSCTTDIMNFFKRFSKVREQAALPAEPPIKVPQGLFSSFTEDISPLPRKSGSSETQNRTLTFKSRKIVSQDSGIASSIRAGSTVTACATGHTSSQNSSRPSSQKESDSTFSVWDVVEDWNNKDTISLTDHKKPYYKH